MCLNLFVFFIELFERFNDFYVFIVPLFSFTANCIYFTFPYSLFRFPFFKHFLASQMFLFRVFLFILSFAKKLTAHLTAPLITFSFFIIFFRFFWVLQLQGLHELTCILHYKKFFYLQRCCLQLLQLVNVQYFIFVCRYISLQSLQCS